MIADFPHLHQDLLEPDLVLRCGPLRGKGNDLGQSVDSVDDRGHLVGREMVYLLTGNNQQGIQQGRKTVRGANLLR